MRDFVLLAEDRQGGRFGDSLRQPRAGCIHIDPDVAVALFAGIVSRKDALHFQLVLRSEQGNLHTLSGARIESPSVVATLYGVAFQPAVRQRNPSVRARVPPL